MLHKVATTISLKEVWNILQTEYSERERNNLSNVSTLEEESMSEAEIQEAWAPSDFGYATRVPNDMLIITVALCYSVIAPMILPFTILYFAVGWFVLRNQVIFSLSITHNLVCF